MKQQIAQLNYLKIAPRKVRFVADLIKGLSVSEAEAQLIFNRRRPSEALLKLLRSAVANAVNNQKMNKDTLVVKSIFVNQGPMLKRFLPRAMGRATPIQKKSSHVVITLEEKEKIAKRFVIVPPPKKEKAKKAKERKAPTPKESRGPDQNVGKKVGFFKRLFRRKSV